MKPPAGMGGGWSEIWKALAAESLNVSTRQELAGRLHVSTRTLQRILVDGDVPDFQKKPSRKVLHSWARTITRLALYFGREPWEWLEAVGMIRDPRLADVVDSVRAAWPPEPSVPADRPLADGLLMDGILAPPETIDAISHHLMKALEKSLPESSVRRRSRLSEWLARLAPGCSLAVEGDVSMRADGADLYNGIFCHSCLAPLSDPDHRGASDVYCRYCSDGSGELLPRPEVLEIMTEWFMHWQPSLDREEARRRADLYMSAMPAWN